eukprot:CCRYP_019606-RA/>CCRYP_019606-RA protein AED:0.14 eAED:0.14 QI:206/1/1/1/0.75/0.6/5/181/615
MAPPLGATTKSARRFNPSTLVFIGACSSILSFYGGVYTGIKVGSAQCSDSVEAAGRGLKGVKSDRGCTPECLAEIRSKDGDLQRNVEALAREKVNEGIMNKLDELCKAHLSKETIPKCDSNNEETTLLPRSLTHFATGLVRVAKDDLMSTIDFGVPPNPDTKGLDALIVYNVKDALPSGISNANSPEIPLLTATNATENCDTLNVVLTNNPGPTRQCLALVGSQYQSYHVQRYMRRDKHHSGLNSKFPLELTSRGLTRNGKVEFPPPSPTDVLDHQESLRTYLNNADGIRKKLKETIDGMGVKTVVVLTCNHGQSELLMNFVCSSRSRGFDLKNVLVFPTDIETKELAEGMGLTTFYEETIMASIPKGEAKFYGDIIFRKVMFAKVLCVQLVNELSHDLLFMDVDIVWYKDPLLYFENKTLPDFDIYFQDDGSRQERYAPYSANSGFYYVRQNERTKHLFRHLLYSGDLINAWYSHQQVLIALLAEYNSLLGLSVKILAKEMEEFPGGVQYHRKNEAMKKIMRRDSNAIIFHMSWTTNKDNKLKFFQQMGEWHVQDKCIGKRFDEITNEPVGTKGALIQPCCSAEPIIKCHYKDKPSIIPCKDSPSIDRNGESFW